MPDLYVVDSFVPHFYSGLHCYALSPATLMSSGWFVSLSAHNVQLLSAISVLVDYFPQQLYMGFFAVNGM